MTVQAVPLYLQVREALVERILDGRLRPSDAIRIRPTAEELGVSPTPLREALLTLELEGFVSARPHCGYVVSAFSKEEIQAVYPMLWGLEALSIEESPPNEGRLARVDGINAEFAAALDDPFRAHELDQRWHEQLVGGWDNALFQSTLVRLRLHAARYELAYMRQRGSVSPSVDQHEQIVDSLRRGARREAARRLRSHWQESVTCLSDWVRQG